MQLNSDYLKGVRHGVLLEAVIVIVIALFVGCTRTFVPSGTPGCPNRSVWSDSAQRCIAREGR